MGSARDEPRVSIHWDRRRGGFLPSGLASRSGLPTLRPPRLRYLGTVAVDEAWTTPPSAVPRPRRDRSRAVSIRPAPPPGRSARSAASRCPKATSPLPPPRAHDRDPHTDPPAATSHANRRTTTPNSPRPAPPAESASVSAGSACARSAARTPAPGTSVGVRFTTWWKRSFSTAPRRPNTRFTHRAKRAPTLFMPFASFVLPAASTIRCTWSSSRTRRVTSTGQYPGMRSRVRCGIRERYLRGPTGAGPRAAAAGRSEFEGGLPGISAAWLLHWGHRRGNCRRS